MARVSSGTDSKQDYETPAVFMAACEKRFGKISFDLAATPINTKSPNFFDFSKGQDAFKLDWPREGLCWLNPPYSARDDSPYGLRDWTKRCKEQAALGTSLLFLVPAAVGSNWFRDNVASAADVYLLNGRIAFVGATDPYTKDLMLCHYSADPLPAKISIWRWMDDEDYMVWEGTDDGFDSRVLLSESLAQIEALENCTAYPDPEDNETAVKLRKALQVKYEG